MNKQPISRHRLKSAHQRSFISTHLPVSMRLFGQFWSTLEYTGSALEITARGRIIGHYRFCYTQGA